MSKPRTVERAVTVTLTLGQIAYLAHQPNGDWENVHPDVRRVFEAGAEAVAVEVERQIPEDVAKEIDAIHALWPHLSRAEDVDCLSAWLKDVRETIAAVSAREIALHKAIGLGNAAGNHDKAMAAAHALKIEHDRAVDESYARDR